MLEYYGYGFVLKSLVFLPYLTTAHRRLRINRAVFDVIQNII